MGGGVVGGLFGAPAPAAPQHQRGVSFGVPAPAPAPAPAALAPAPAQHQPGGSAFAQSARSAALAKKWKAEVAELHAMGLSAYTDGLPELLEQTNGSINEALDLLMA